MDMTRRNFFIGSMAVAALGARRMFADPAADGVAAIAMKGDVVEIGVRTLPGLSYGLLVSDDLRTWTPVGVKVRGTGDVRILTAPRFGDRAFFRATLSD